MTDISGLDEAVGVLEVSKYHLEIKRYKKSLLKTMLNRAFHLPSTWESFKSECDHLKATFTNLKIYSKYVKSSRCASQNVTVTLVVHQTRAQRKKAAAQYQLR